MLTHQNFRNLKYKKILKLWPCSLCIACHIVHTFKILGLLTLNQLMEIIN